MAPGCLHVQTIRRSRQRGFTHVACGMCDNIPWAGRQAGSVPPEISTIHSQESSTAGRLCVAGGEQGMGIFVSVFCKLLHPALNHCVAVESYRSPRALSVVWLSLRQTCRELDQWSLGVLSKRRHSVIAMWIIGTQSQTLPCFFLLSTSNKAMGRHIAVQKDFLVNI